MSNDRDRERERLGRIARTASYRFYGDTRAIADDPWPEEESKDVYEAIAAAVAEEVAGRYERLVRAVRVIRDPDWDPDDGLDMIAALREVDDAFAALDGGTKGDAHD